MTDILSIARFAVLEQYLPDGEKHPFAVTMLNHFSKLNSPLKTAIRNPSAEDQRKRFSRGNWKDIDFRSLWSLWSDDKFLPPDERRALDHVEPFDEWEEFQLFCSHYFLLLARNTVASPVSPNADDTVQYSNTDGSTYTFASQYRSTSGEPRRFGASIEKQGQMQTTGGYGLQSRLETTEMLHPCGDLEMTYSPHNSELPALPAAVMCHTTTLLVDGRVLLVGGRASPSSSSASCYLRRQGEAWTRVDPLPFGLYRHTAVSISIRCEGGPLYGVLVFGGKKGPAEINDKWLLWTEQDGWTVVKCAESSESPEPRFGAAMSTSYEFCGRIERWYLTGGIGTNGVVLQDFYEIKTSWSDNGELIISCRDMSRKIRGEGKSRLSSIGRFGASLVPIAKAENGQQQLLLIGGVVSEHVLSQSSEVLVLDISDNQSLEVLPASVDWHVRPMLIGCSVQDVDDSTVVIAYGGAVCFSFGTYWNEGIWTISNADNQVMAWKVVKRQEIAVNHPNNNLASTLPIRQPTMRSTGYIAIESPGDMLDVAKKTTNFDAIMHAGQPLILRGLDLGPCSQTWNADYLKQNIGPDRPMIVHSAASSTMNFLAKDFEYATIPFGELIDKIAAGERLYMRAISKDTNKATSLEEDFPTIAKDFQVPPELVYITANMHSSVLRMSGPVNMWLHFDVQANVYCQIQGEKRLVLFPPTDVQLLDFPAGASSSRLNIFDGEGQAHYPANTHPFVFDVQSGDVLYIPPLWLHTAKPTTSTSIAVNVFFRSLQSGYAAGKDVYGNRDLQAYENGRRDVAKMTKAFKGLPEDVRKFYLSRLAAEILEAAV